MTNAPYAFSPDWRRAAEAVRGCPVHAPTPLRRIDIDGVGVLVKNESERFGIGSFKALGGVYAVLDAARDRYAELDGERPPTAALLETERRESRAALTFVCASAGNHGIAVATGAALIGARARIHLSAEVPEDFAARLRARGAEVVRSGRTYEESLDGARRDAEDDDAARLIADTAWTGYVEVPARIMEGYTVIGEELRAAFERHGRWPSEVYLQAGVGGLAGAMTWTIRHRWTVQPRIVIVEPEAAPCLARSAEIGEPATVEGPVSTMGRLDCKTASPLAVDALADASVDYLAVDDAAAEAAAAMLAEHGIATTPSGAAGLAGWRIERGRGSTVGETPLVIVSEEALGSD